MPLDPINRWHLLQGKLREAGDLQNEARELYIGLYAKHEQTPSKRLEDLIIRAHARYVRRYYARQRIEKQLMS